MVKVQSLKILALSHMNSSVAKEREYILSNNMDQG